MSKERLPRQVLLVSLLFQNLMSTGVKFALSNADVSMHRLPNINLSPCLPDTSLGAWHNGLTQLFCILNSSLSRKAALLQSVSRDLSQYFFDLCEFRCWNISSRIMICISLPVYIWLLFVLSVVFLDSVTILVDHFSKCCGTYFNLPRWILVCTKGIARVTFTFRFPAWYADLLLPRWPGWTPIS